LRITIAVNGVLTVLTLIFAGLSVQVRQSVRPAGIEPATKCLEAIPRRTPS